jgi:hypothetical protein
VDALASFSPDYATARRRFRDAATRAGWTLEAHSVKAPHPVGQELTVDVATTPGREGEPTVFVSSGLHGVEAFIGSAVQIGLLEHWGTTRPKVRCVFAHALNPYGFACIRRANEENIDPNRNFLGEDDSYRGSPKMYARLNHLLNPERPPSRREAFTLKAMLIVARFGMTALKQAIAEGQFDFPRGIFFGGARPSRTNQILTENLGRWMHGSNEVIHLDFHTGLGPSATCKLLIDFALTDKQRTRLTRWFGPDSFEICDPKLISYHVRGGFDRWCTQRIPDCDYLHLCAEFGTYGPLAVLGGLRAENQAHHWGQPADPATLRTKERLKELFCPASPRWRGRSFGIGVDLVNKAINCLADQNTPGGN